MARGVVVHSVTGEEIDLKSATLDQLAEALDRIEDERNRVLEKQRLVAREIATRVPLPGRELTERFSLNIVPNVYVSRRDA